jgi:HAD superfamily hydrolase (TIGR01509 family)
MKFKAVIFDMDGLLINSEPYWEEAGGETLQEFGVSLTPEQYHSTTGLRTKEWIDWWFTFFNVDKRFAHDAETTIVLKAIEKIREHGVAMPGVEHIFKLFKEMNFKIGLATSSPIALIDVVAEKLAIKHYLNTTSSAESLEYSKPHPQVFLNCAEQLGVSPLECFCFEDSFNGMISVKAARMKCIIVPAVQQFDLARWGAADIKLSSLEEFKLDMLQVL